MNVLVAYATRHGATREIAQRIADILLRQGLEVSVDDVDRIGDVSGHDAFVIGSAAYMGRWLSGASAFVRRHRSELAGKPVWLFSSGPVGTDTVDAKGNDVRTAAEPKEFAELEELLHPRDAHVFWGAYDPNAEPIGFAEALGHRIIRMIPPAREMLPAGDFRNWVEIESWAESIADQLTPERVGAIARWTANPGWGAWSATRAVGHHRDAPGANRCVLALVGT